MNSPPPRKNINLQMMDYAAKVKELIKHIEENYTTNLPEDFTPPKNLILKESAKTSSLENLFTSLKNAEVDAHGCLAIAFDIHRVSYPHLMIRECYIDLAWRVLKNGQWSLVLGSPGVGKTVFSIFLVYLLIKAGEKKNIPILFCLRRSVCFYNQGHLYLLDRINWISLNVDSSNIFFLYNGEEPAPSIFVASTAFIFSSPKVDCYREFRKNSGAAAMTYFMPLWSLEELQRLNAAIPNNSLEKLADNELCDRFDYAGGVARVVFQQWMGYKSLVKCAIRDMSPTYLYQPEKERFEKGPHAVVGIFVNTVDTPTAPAYTTYQCGFLSTQLRAEVVTALVTKTNTMVEYVLKEADNPFRTKWVNEVFEEVSQRLLSNGVETELVPLEPIALAISPHPWNLSLPRASKEFIRTERDVKVDGTEPKLWVPISGSLPVVDFFFTLPMTDEDNKPYNLVVGLQVTLNTRHGINNERAGVLRSLFKDNFVLVWVLGASHFKKFKVQNYLNEKGNVILDPKKIKQVPQFKLDLFDADFLVEDKPDGIC